MTASGPSERAVADVEEVLRARARALAVPRGAREVDGRSTELHLVARIGDRTVAVPAARARHVVASTPLARLVGCGTAVVGLAAVHGELIPIVDVSALLQLDTDGSTAGRHFVVVDDDEGSIGLVVDQVVALRSLHPDEVAAGVSAHPSGAVAGVAPGGLYVLDLDGLLADPRLRPPAAVAEPGAGGLGG